MLKKKGLVITISIIVAILLVTILGYVILKPNNVLNESNVSAELEKMRTYDRVQAGEENTNSEYVQFDGFFLCDLDGDGNADKVRGTCKEIGKEDTLYMELNVLTDGYLKDGKITINSDNFYFETAIVKDGEVSENYIGSNTKEIDLNKINNGTQKLLTGVVKSGDYSKNYKADAIDGDPEKYSRVNSVTLTGTHVIENEDGTTIETPISKTVNFNIDWYGEVDCTIPSSGYLGKENKNQQFDITDCLDEKNQKLNLSFNIFTSENKNELILKKSYVEGTIPDMNGYAPISVSVAGTNVTYTYDENTRIFTAQREAVLNNEGKISLYANSGSWYSSRYNEYVLNISYPLAAYSETNADTLEMRIPIKAYYEGYNNVSSEFSNPYKSNIANDIITVTWSNPQGTTAIFRNYVGKYTNDPYYNYVISKEKPLNIYNGVSIDEVDDCYITKWVAYTGVTGESDGLIMKESSDESLEKISDTFIKMDSTEENMSKLVKNVGIYFSNPVNLLGENGWIKVYDDDTDKEIATFTKDNWSNYSENNPYMYEKSVLRIRIETSSTYKEKNLIVYNLKELDDEYITKNYSIDEYESLKYIKSTLVGYIKKDKEKMYINTDIAAAEYIAPVSVANISIPLSNISTQKTQKDFKVELKTSCNSFTEKKWKNGTFLLRFPKEILDIYINEITIDNENVIITNYEKYEEDGNVYIKILTSNDEPANFKIVVNCEITPNPRAVTSSVPIELYAVNENCENYYYKAEDVYDIDNDLNIKENVNYRTTKINIISPNSLLTSQEAREFSSEDKVAIAPQKADINKEQRTAKVVMNITNNYTNTVTDIKILGKIPFKNNTYILSQKETGSTYSTTMTDKGIIIPEELKDIVKVYYSSNENPTKDVNDESNNWKEDVEDFSKVKSFLIDFGDYILEKNDTYDFSYEIQLPEGVEYNQISYSVHSVYFTLNTEQGKYRTQTEPSKLGFIVAKKYNLELTKYQKNNNKTVNGATYSIIEEGEEQGKTITTKENGKVLLKGLYAGKVYILKEIKSPIEYELNNEEIKFRTVLNGDNLDIQIIEGNVKNAKIIKNEGEDYKLEISVEDEVKVNLQITKTEKVSNNVLKDVKYRLLGKGIESEGKILTTNSEGKILLDGLYLNEVYSLEEVKATGYYLASTIKFTITEDDGIFKVNLIEGTVNKIEIVLNNEIPTCNINIENEKIPTYNLKIIKQEKNVEKRLAGAEFKIEGEGISEPQYYVTDENGEIIIENLYQYFDEKGMDCNYTLTEIYAPEGYSAIEPIEFKGEMVDGVLKVKLLDGEIKEQQLVDDSTIAIVVEDKPVFNLIKQDSETDDLLPNAKFIIYELDDDQNEIGYAKDANGNIVGNEVVTNEYGKISCGLKAGFYKAVEIEAPEGYELPENEEDRSYYFGIDRSWRNSFVNHAYNMGVTKVDDGIVVVNDEGKVTKYDFDGNFIWQNNVANNYSYIDVISVDDGIIAIANNAIVKYSFNGNIIWKKAVEGELKSFAKAKDGFVTIDNRNKTLTIYNNDGELISKIVDKDGSFYNGVVSDDDIVTVSLNGIIAKYNFNGDILWKKTGLSYQFLSIDLLNDGFITTTYDNKIVKFDFDGNIVKEVSYDKSKNIEIQTVKDGYVLVGGGYNPSIAKYDLDGNEVWTKIVANYDGPYTDVIELDDGYVAVGVNEKITKYDFNGDILWNNENVEMNSVDTLELKDGILIFAHSQGTLYKYDLDGNMLWKKSIDSYSKIFKISDGIIISSPNGKISKYDYNGNIVWEDESGKEKYNECNELNEAMYFIGEHNLVKYSLDGTFEWKQYFNDNVRTEKIIDVNDGIVIINNDTSNKCRVIIKYDYNGKMIWSNNNRNYKFTELYWMNDSLIGVTKEGVVIAYDSTGNIVWESIDECNYNSSIKFDDGIIICSNKGKIIKYDYDGNVLWKNEEKTYEYSKIVDMLDGIIATSTGGQVVKYDYNGNIVWENSVGRCDPDFVLKVDDGIILAGKYLDSKSYLGETMIIKYDLDGNIIKSQILKNRFNSKDTLEAVYNINNFVYVGIYYKGSMSKNGVYFSRYYSDILRFTSDLKCEFLPDEQNISITNTLKQFKITTDVKEYEETIDGETKTIKGGTISGEDEKPYEKVKYGKDSINEIKAIPDEGYKIISITVNDKDIDFIPDEDGSVTLDKFINMQEDKHVVVTFSNTRSNVKVHHYMATKNADKSYTYTNIKLADDENITGKIGDKYTTAPKVNLDKYTLIMDEDGEYILPDNCTGVFTNDTQDVNYYYYEKKVPLTVNYYIEGTTEKVPSINGDVVESINSTGDEGSEYNTVSSPDVLQKYELVAIPANANGILEFNEVVVNYYYRLKTENITTEVKVHDEIDELGIVKQVKGGTISGENEMPYETVEFGENSTKEIVAKADKGYKIKSIQVQSINNDGIVTTEDVAVEENSVEFKLDLFENVVENKHVIVEFEKMKSRVLVHYYIEGTEDKVPTIDGVAGDVETEGNIGDIYATKEAENVIDRYELIQIPENASGEYTEDEIVVIYYYRAKDAHVNVHHYLEGTTEKVSDDVSIDGKVGDAYATTVATDIDEKYELVAEPNNKNGTMTEETIEVIYYYRVKDTKLIVKYIDKSTGDFMYKADGTQETEIVAIGKVGSEYSTNAKEYEGYTLVETTDNTSGILTIEPIEVIYYYLPQTRATVQYIDKTAGNILDERTDNGLVGDLFETDSKDFDGYILVEEPKEKIVKMTKDEIVLKYYYIHISAGVIEKHIDIIDNSILANEVHKGNEGDEYNIPSRSFEGYDLVEDRLPTNNVGTMTVEPITVTYYYIHKAKVTVRYVDKITGKDLTEQIIQNGHEGDLYTTENKDFDGYELTEIPDNATGTMTRDTINIIYYYIHESAGVRVNHYDVMTNEKIAEEKIIKGKEGEEYTTSEENIAGYDLVKEKYPNNATGTMTVDEIIVNYYYIKKSNIIVRHVDKLTGKDIIDKEEIIVYEGDSYTTSSKQFIGYKLIEEPANKDGVMKKETIEVIYYYIRPAKVKVNYIDIDTGKEIEESIEIDGNEGDTYTTSEKDIKYYELVKEPENKNGKMTVEVVGDIVNNTIEVNYYYRKLDFNLKLDKIVDSVIINGKKTVVNGDLGKVEVPRKELASAKVQVIYRIRVINNSKIAGKAEVMEIIPEGMKMTAVDNAKWKINGTTATISTGNIEPGKYEDIEVVMSWDNKEDSIGNIENIAQITGTDNDAGFAQSDEKDDADSANVIVAVGTGETTYVVMTGVLLFILSGAALMIVAKREE